MMKTLTGMTPFAVHSQTLYQYIFCILSDDIKRLLHLKYCIKESMRLFPPVCAVGRVLDQDTDITGYMMPKGTTVTFFIHAVHRHPDFWENPNVILTY